MKKVEADVATVKKVNEKLVNQLIERQSSSAVPRLSTQGESV